MDGEPATADGKATRVKVSELGEFALIERIAARLPAYHQDVRAAVGDDVAVLARDDDHHQLATCDIQVEAVHFRRESITAFQLGRSSVAINLCNVAAKGGTPQHLLPSYAVGPDFEVEWMKELYDGLGQEASRYGVDVVGGILSRT